MDTSHSTHSSRRREAHYAVSRLLAESATLREAAPQILEAICRHTGWLIGGLWAVDAERGELYSLVSWQSPEFRLPAFEIATQERRFQPGIGLPGRVWARGHPEWIADVTLDRGFVRSSEAAQAGLHAAVAFPIRLAEQVLGVMEFFSREIREPEPELMRVGETIGHQIGQFIVRCRAEKQLRESEARFRLVVDAAPSALLMVDDAGKITLVNEEVEKLFGYGREELMGQPVEMLLPERYGAKYPGLRADFLKEPSVRPMRAGRELFGRRKDGVEVPLEIGLNPLQVGNRPHVLASIIDITGRQQAEAALRESEARYRRLAEAMPQIAWTALPDGEIDYFNERWYKFTGLPPGQVGIKAWKAVVHPDDYRRCLNRWRKAVKSGRVFQMERRFREAKTGAYQWFLSRAVPVRNAQGRVVRWYGTSTNIADQKRAEARHVQINDTLYSILEAIPDVVFVTRIDGQIDFQNPAARRFARVVEFEHTLPAPIQRELNQVLQTGEHHLPTGFKTVHRFEIGQEDRFYLSRIVAMRTPEQQVFGAVVTLQDVTEFRLLDEVKTNLISTVSHELKTPITSLRTALLLLLEQRIGSLNSSQLEMMMIARDETERLLRTLNTLLDLTRFENDAVGIAPEITPVEQLVHAALAEVQAQAEVAGVKIHTDMQSELPPLKVDRERMIHVLTNLLTNAIKYSPPGAEVKVRTGLEDEHNIRISVVDQGPGVPQEYHSRIFDKFFRVPDSPQRGAGLGLSIAREFVRAHRGVMNLKSDPGKGSEFYFVLPFS